MFWWTQYESNNLIIFIRRCITLINLARLHPPEVFSFSSQEGNGIFFSPSHSHGHAPSLRAVNQQPAFVLRPNKIDTNVLFYWRVTSTDRHSSDSTTVPLACGILGDTPSNEALYWARSVAVPTLSQRLFMARKSHFPRQSSPSIFVSFLLRSLSFCKRTEAL